MVFGPSRRAVCLGGTAILLAACGGRSGSQRGDGSSHLPPSRAGTPPTASESPEAEAGLPTVHRWLPDPNDLAPDCKGTAVRRIESLGNGTNAALQVIDAQYGGLLPDSASVLVVTRSWRRHGAHLIAGGHTFDVRLSRAPRGWRVTTIHPSAPGPAASLLTSAARRVLASDRLDLPPAGSDDIASGRVHDSVLRAMLSLAGTFRVGVSVVRSGHPRYVFGTDRLSDHPQGRAFDTWRIDGYEVVDARTPRSLVEEFMHAAADAGSYNVGGPYLLGAAPQWFSDATHHDHVHAGFAT